MDGYRRYMRALLLILFTVLVLTAVSVTSLAQEQIVLRYSDTMDDAAARAGEGQVLQQLIDLFMELNPDIKVEIVWGGLSKFDVEYLAGVSPDVVRSTHEPLRRRARQNMFLPLDEFVEKSGFDMTTLFPSVVDGFKEGGVLYGMPMYFGTLALHFNKNMFDRAGVPYPTAPNWSWEEDFVEAGRRLLQDRDGDGVPDQWITAYHRSNLLAPLMAARGAAFIADDLKTWVGASSATIETLQWLQDQIHFNKIIAYPMGDRDAFYAEQTAMVGFGSWGLTGMYESLTFDWDLAEMPMSTETGRRGTRWNADGWAISNQTKYPEAAWRLASFISSREAQELIAIGRLGTPVHIEVARELFLDPSRPQNLEVFLQGTNYMWIDKRHEVDREISRTIESALNFIERGEKSAFVAIQEISAAVEAALSLGGE